MSGAAVAWKEESAWAAGPPPRSKLPPSPPALWVTMLPKPGGSSPTLTPARLLQRLEVHAAEAADDVLMGTCWRPGGPGQAFQVRSQAT